MKTLIATLVAAAIASTVVYLVFHNRINRLQAENQELIARRDNSPPPETVAPEESHPAPAPSANPEEISQLRKEAGALRQQTNEMQQTLQAETLSFQARELSLQAKRSAWNLMLTIRAYTSDFGTNVVQANLEHLKILTRDGTTTNLDLEQFEIVPNPAPWNSNTPDAIVLRERIPRQTPDGQWARVYGLVDGSVTEQISANGYIDPWERQHLITTQTNP